MDLAEITLTTGETLIVRGTLDEIEEGVRRAGTGAGILWLTEHGTGGSVGVRANHLVLIRPSEASGEGSGPDG